MSLRTTYSGALDTALALARTNGISSITTNLSTITTELSNAAAAGKKSFTVNIPVTFQPSDLRLKGKLWEAYKTGIEEKLSSEDIYGDEITVELNTSDTISTTVDLKFKF